MNARVTQLVEHRSGDGRVHNGGWVATIRSAISGVINRENRSDNSCGSSPPSRTKHYKWKLFEWKNEIGDPLYMTRWMLDLWFFSIRLHKFSRSDDDRALHDHAWSFITIILKGGYWDVTKDGRKWIGPGSIRYRSNTHRHTIEIPEGKSSWSIIITSRYVHRWGFYIKNKLGREKFLNSQRYFRRFGHH